MKTIWFSIYAIIMLVACKVIDGMTVIVIWSPRLWLQFICGQCKYWPDPIMILRYTMLATICLSAIGMLLVFTED